MVKGTRNKLLTWFLFFLCVVLAFNFVRSWWQRRERGDIIQKSQLKLEQMKQEQENLKRELARVESFEYIEKQARDKLNMGRVGEAVMILPPITPKVYPTPTPIDQSSNWEKWLRVFL